MNVAPVEARHSFPLPAGVLLPRKEESHVEDSDANFHAVFVAAENDFWSAGWYFVLVLASSDRDMRNRRQTLIWATGIRVCSETSSRSARSRRISLTAADGSCVSAILSDQSSERTAHPSHIIDRKLSPYRYNH